MNQRIVSVAVIVLAAACGGASTDFADEQEELSATLGDFKLDLRPGAGDGEHAVFRGTANKTLASARTFVIDDEVGATRLTREGFTSEFARNELVQWLGGHPVFVQLSWKDGEAKRGVTARADFRASLVQRSGSGEIKPRAWFQAFQVDGRSVVRIRGRVPTNVLEAGAVVLGRAFAGRGEGRELVIDVPTDLFAEAAAQNRVISLTIRSEGEGTLRGGFAAVATVGRLKLTDGDPEQVWPPAACTDEVRACIAASGDDTSACGDSYTVTRCPPKKVSRLSKAAAQRYAQDAADEHAARTLPLLVRIHGRARGEELSAAATAKAIPAIAEALAGRSYASAAAVREAAAGLAAGAFLGALARPLSLMAPSPAKPGDDAAARVEAVEALLAWLADKDLTRTEYGRSLDQLVMEHADAWTADLEALRLGKGDAACEKRADRFACLGRLLSAHVEVDVALSSGRATRVLFETD